MKTVMIVDDESSILEQVKESLREHDLELVTVKNNREALELMQDDNENNYELLLIDSLTPDSKKPAFFPMKPSDTKNIDTTNDADFLQKPFTKEELISFVKKRV